MLNKKIVVASLVLSNALLFGDPLIHRVNIDTTNSLDAFKGAQNVFLMREAIEHRRDLGKLVVHRDKDHYHVMDESKKLHRVEPHNLCKDLRAMNPETLAKLAAVGGAYVSVNQNSDGKYSLAFRDRLRGGGPITGAILGWGTRILAYGALGVTATAATAAVVTTGGALGAGAQAVIVGVVNGGSLAAGGATAAMLAADAAVVEGAALGGATIMMEAAALGASTVAYIEMGATAAQVAGTAIWFLP